MPGLQRAERQAVHRLREQPADDAPAFVVDVLARRLLRCDAEHLSTEPAHADGEHHAENPRVLGLRLDTNPIRPLHVATQDCPHHAAGEHHARRVADQRVPAVHVAVQELERRRHLVVDFQHGGHAEQDEETEIDHRVHKARTAVAQQRAHVDPGAEVGEPALHVLGGRAPVVGRAALPVADAVGETQRAPDEHHRDDGVERNLQRTRNAAEHLAVHGRLVLPAGDGRQDARHQRERADAATEDDRQLVGLQARRLDAGAGASPCMPATLVVDAVHLGVRRTYSLGVRRRRGRGRARARQASTRACAKAPERR